MTDEQFGLALNYPAARALDVLQVELDAESQKRLHEHRQRMTLIFEKAEAAQEVVSSIYANTLMLADASIAMRAYIKTAQSSSRMEQELAEFDHLQTKLLLEALKQLAFNATNDVFSLFDS